MILESVPEGGGALDLLIGALFPWVPRRLSRAAGQAPSEEKIQAQAAWTSPGTLVRGAYVFLLGILLMYPSRVGMGWDIVFKMGRHDEGLYFKSINLRIIFFLMFSAGNGVVRGIS